LVTDVVAAHAPLFEKTSIDEFYLDLTGMDKHFGCYKWSLELRQCIMRETGLPISFGLSVNKTVSKVGTGEAKPNGTLEIAPGREKGFLAPLPVGKIPGVGRETQMQLSFMGVRTVSVLSEMPVKLLEREFGKAGRQLWLKSNGIDTTPVEPWNDQKSMSAERTLTEDTLDLVFIRRLLGGLVEKLAWQLRQEAKLASCITVKIRYADFNTFSRQKRIAYTANDKSLLHAAQELFEQLYQRRQLIRLVGVRLSGLVRGHYQMSLFDDTAEEVELLQAMDRLRNRYGSKSIGRAAHLLNK
jgi:DNA polymerase IV